MIIFTPCWGQPYIDWLKRGLLQSFMWPKNYKSIANAQWEIFTTHESYEEVRSINFPIETSVHVVPLLQGLVNTVEKCLAENQPLLMATADMIFSDGTIDTFKKVGRQPFTAVSMAHVRVLPDFLENVVNLSRAPHSGMVSCAWEYLHDSWVFGQVGREPTNCYLSGVCWRYVTSNVVAVQHRLPNPFYINLHPSDFDVIKNYTVFNAWDTYFPGDCLVGKGRNRVIGSSDAGFVVELTESHKNVPGRAIAPGGEEDSYHMDYPHNQMNRQFVSIFRM